MKKNLFALLVVCCLINSCDDDEDVLEQAAPGEVLLMVDGAKVKSIHRTAYLLLKNMEKTETLEIDADFESNEYSINANVHITIQSPEENTPLIAREFNIGGYHNSIVEASLIYHPLGATRGPAFSAVEEGESVGKVKITKLDRDKRMVSGYFQGALTEQGSTNKANVKGTFTDIPIN